MLDKKTVAIKLIKIKGSHIEEADKEVGKERWPAGQTLDFFGGQFFTVIPSNTFEEAHILYNVNVWRI